VKKPTAFRVAGALAIMFAAATVILLSVRLHDSQNNVAALDRANTAMAASIRHDHHVLTELCNTNSVLNGLVAQTIVLFQRDLASKALPPSVISTYKETLETFKGYHSILNEHTACNQIRKP
jgi:hypothetical protein